ncbi:MAG: GNAT family N-acetyltransferase [Pseudomonadota bacterium]
MEAKLPIENNTFEIKRFGIAAAKVVDTNASIEEINSAAKVDNIEFLSIRVSTDDLPRVQALEADGYRLMDTLVYYGRSLTNVLNCPDSMIRVATPSDANAVAKVAEAGFADYVGHYHVDPRLPNTGADAAYVEWAENSVKMCGLESPVLVAEEGNRILGFVAMQINLNSEAEIVLNAVHPDFQGQGIYNRLLAASLALSAQSKCETVITSTQINNVAVQRVWSRQGLRMVRSYYTLHKWF